MAEPAPPTTPPGPAQEWKSVTHRFVVGGHKGYVIVATDRRGAPVYIEILMSKEGGTLRGLLDSLSACVCVGLDRGIPLSAYTTAMKHVRFEPSGHTPRGFAHSVVDYVFRWIGDRFPDPAPETEFEPAPDPVEGPTCSVCALPIVWTPGDACPECGHVD